MFRRSLTTLVLPVNFDSMQQSAIPLTAYVASQEQARAPRSPALMALALTLARSHLLVQFFRSVTRHLNDREELALLLDGINRILLARGDDVGVVAQAMLSKCPFHLKSIYNQLTLLQIILWLVHASDVCSRRAVATRCSCPQ